MDAPFLQGTLLHYLALNAHYHYSITQCPINVTGPSIDFSGCSGSLDMLFTGGIPISPQNVLV